MKYFTWKPKQWQREPFVLQKEINTAGTGKISRNIWFSQAMWCWITTPKHWTVLGLLQIVLQTIRTVTSLFGSELQDTCFMLMPTPWIHCKRWHSGWADQLSIQFSVCISYLQYHVWTTPVNIWSKSCINPTNTRRFQFHIKVMLKVVLLYRVKSVHCYSSRMKFLVNVVFISFPPSPLSSPFPEP